MSSSPLPRVLLWLNHICVENVIRLSIGVHYQLQVVLFLQLKEFWFNNETFRDLNNLQHALQVVALTLHHGCAGLVL